MKKILAVIVNYNQEKEIERFLIHLKKYWPVQDAIVVDDGSKDHSVAIADRVGFKVLLSAFNQNQGVGAAIRRGVQYANQNGYEAVLILSSNGKMMPEEIERVVHPIRQSQADYVTGSRFLDGGSSPGLSLFRRISIPVFSWISRFCYGQAFSDITCGFRCYRIDFLFRSDLNINQEWLNRYEMEYYIHFYACKFGFKIQEVPVTIKYDHLDAKRKSKIRPIIDWWSMIRPMIYLKLRIRS